MKQTKLNLPDGQRTLVFRKIESILKADKTLASVMQDDDSWKTFYGNPNDAAPMSPRHDAKGGPSIRLYPSPGPMVWTSVESMEAPLYINIECCVLGLIADDVLNIQEAIENALYPSDPSAYLTIQSTLVAAPYYCMTGLIEFSMPLWDRRGDMGTSGNWYPIGQIKIDIRRTVVH